MNAAIVTRILFAGLTPNPNASSGAVKSEQESIMLTKLRDSPESNFVGWFCHHTAKLWVCYIWSGLESLLSVRKGF